MPTYKAIQREVRVTSVFVLRHARLRTLLNSSARSPA
jgi:hypothetical protein